MCKEALSVLVFCVLVAVVAAGPIEDVQIVESTIREVRALAPDDLLLAATSYGQHYGGDDEDSVGYLKRSNDGGSDGYKHFDSYHIKDGDKYGYEKHTAFGKANNEESDAGSKDDGEKKEGYKVAEEINEDDDGENYETVENYTDAEGDQSSEGEADGHYTEGENFESDDGEFGKYSEADDDKSEAEELQDY